MPLDGASAASFGAQLHADLEACARISLVLLGHQLGLYQTLLEAGPLTSVELALASGTDGPLVRQWLASQHAIRYLEHDARTGRYRLPAERALVLADDASPHSQGRHLDALGECIGPNAELLDLFRLEGADALCKPSPPIKSDRRAMLRNLLSGELVTEPESSTRAESSVRPQVSRHM